MGHDNDGKQAEERLRLLAAIVEDSDDAILTKDLDGVITSWNDGARRLYGYSAEEAIGQPMTLLLPPDRSGEEAQILDRIRRGEGVDHFETVRRCKDGRLIDVSVTISPIHDHAGRIVGASSITRDITSRKQADEKLATSEVRYRRLFESAKDGILILNAQTGQVVDVNPFLIELLDLSREEFLGKEVWELGFLGDAMANQEAFAELREKGYVRYEDLPLKSRSGRQVNVEFVSNVYLEDHQDVIQCNIRDISERKWADAALNASEARYKTLFDGAAEGIMVADIETRHLMYVNAAACEMFGYNAAEMERMSVEDLHPKETLTAAIDGFDAQAQGKVRKLPEVPCLRKGGSVFYVDISTSPAVIDGRQCNVGFFTDVTDSKQRGEREHLAREVLEILNRPEATAATIREILALIKESLGFEAVGIRLRDGNDFPYYETNGFPQEFVESERYLCAYDEEGNIACDREGNPVLAGKCGDTILGRTNPALPFFTESGSFWTNSTTDLLASTSEADRRQSGHRNRCNGEGYESVALIPLRSGTEMIGLLQLNDRRRDRFTLEMVQFLEGLGASIGIALAREQARAEIQSLARFPSENPSVVLRIAADGDLLYANEVALKQLPHWQLKVGQPVLPMLLDLVGQALNDGAAREVNAEHGERVYSFHVAPIAGAGYANLYGSDITERNQAEEALQRSERLYRSLVEHLPQRVFLKDRNSVYLSCNANYAIDLGIAPEDIVGKDDFAFYPRELAEGYRADDQAVMETATLREVEERYQIAGQARWIHTIKVPYHDAQGRVVGILGVFEDVTDHRQLEEQLRQAQKMEAVGQLAGGVAHDFNNLLTGIGGFVGFARDAVEIGSQAYADLGQVLTLVDRAAGLTRQLLAFSRRQPLAPVVINVNELISDYVKMLGRLLREDVDVQFVPAPELWNVRADPGQIEQVVTNMAVNARDAMPNGGKLVIETANVKLREEYARDHADVVPGLYVVIAMSDTGCGMDAATQKRIFDPFFTTKEFGKGTGLGLATVYGVVKQHGGHIRVYSEPGRGTTFRVYLPRFAGEAEKPRTPSTLITGGTETILLVEDEETIRAVSRRHLESFGYTVLCAADPDEAEDVAANCGKRIDLLLTDVIMPGRNGRELYESLVAKQPGLKVLYMSGYTDNVVVRNNVLGVETSLLQKPFGGHDLAGKVREALDG